MVNLYILCGLPFSGKSMLGKEMSERFGYTLISFDDVWESMYAENKDITYDLVLIDCRKQIANSLAEGLTVVYDSTNPKDEHREDLKTIAEFMRMKTKVVYLKFPIEEIQKRRAKSLIDKTHHVVSDENFDNAVAQLEEPTDAIVIQNEEDKKEFLDSLE